MRWVLVNKLSNTVENIIIWDGVGDLFLNTNYIPIQLTEDENTVQVGWLYNETDSIRFKGE